MTGAKLYDDCMEDDDFGSSCIWSEYRGSIIIITTVDNNIPINV